MIRKIDAINLQTLIYVKYLLSSLGFSGYTRDMMGAKSTSALVIKLLPFSTLLPLFLLSFARASSGTEGAAFLDIPVGGRSAAMGSAYSALANDAYAATIN